jgi:large subunit ribosomal protein L3
MEKAIIGKKIGMTQLFEESGRVIPVTVIEAGPCVVVQKKDVENDGYVAVQLGFGDLSERKTTKPLKGHFDKGQVGYKKYLREFKLDNASELNVGDTVLADIFKEGDRVDVTGISKGKGFAGAVKRWHFGRQKESHGTGPVHRSLGSTGAGSTPGKVIKGKKMAGHMGNEQVTVQNLDVVKVDVEKNIIAVKGAVPGPKGGVVTIKNSVKSL